MSAWAQFRTILARRSAPVPQLGIAHKLTLIFALFAALLLGIADWLAYRQGETALRESLIAELQEQAIGKQASITTWLDEKLSDLRAFAIAPQTVAYMTKLASHPAEMTKDDLTQLTAELVARADGHDYGALIIVNATSGEIIAATDPADGHLVNAAGSYFGNGKMISDFYFSPVQVDDRRSRSVMLSAPLRTQSGAPEAIVIGRLDAESIAQIVDRRAGFRHTDETYLVDTGGNYISQPRLRMTAKMTGPDHSEAVRRCLAHDDGLAEAEDYRGIQTVAVYRWMTKFGLCLVTKVDQAEAYASIDQLSKGLVVGGLFLLLLASGISVVLARMITRPIRLIEAGLERIEHGERNLALSVASGDELGRLARAVTKMTTALAAQESQLRHHAAELEQRVAEKTRELAQRADELARSNVELERFAYVASHDLQEPLRMVASYTQLLAKRYKGKLDANANEFIDFAVDGVTRMQALINDLLTYSRVSTQGRSFEVVDCDLLVDRALKNLQAAQNETQAVVRRGALPKVTADGSQLTQLFQNLIGNAFKFCNNRAPEVDIAVRRDGAEWLFSIADNGIGIDARYIEQLFVVFKRLHTRSEYPGTGIGLAICKKVVERHGGRIWVESKPGEGSTFYFTIPARADDDRVTPDWPRTSADAAAWPAATVSTS